MLYQEKIYQKYINTGGVRNTKCFHKDRREEQQKISDILVNLSTFNLLFNKNSQYWLWFLVVFPSVLSVVNAWKYLPWYFQYSNMQRKLLNLSVPFVEMYMDQDEV